MHFLNSSKLDLAKLICVDFGKSEFRSINICNCYKALYWRYSSISRHLEFIRPIRMTSCNFKHDGFLKPGGYVFINTWNTEIYVSLLLRQNKLRLKIWNWLKLDCSYLVNWNIRPIKELSLWQGFGLGMVLL